jgi:EAL domain-containing protein (putative c-di-GMP-specific phosphodiesterase class I)
MRQDFLLATPSTVANVSSSVIEDLARARERISELEAENQKLRERSHELQELLSKDPHTGLPLRREFERAIEREITRVSGSSNGTSVAVCVLRLDKNYRRIKNSRDRNRVFLFKATQRIREAVGPHVYQSDRVDEFICLLHGVTSRKHAARMAHGIYDSVSRPHDPPADDVLFGCHIGVALFPGSTNTKEELFSAADIALTEAESASRPFVIYGRVLGKRSRENRYVEKELSRSIRNGFEHFDIHYQPLVSTDFRILGAEALARYHHPELGEIPPTRFVRLAEESDSLRFIGHWVLYHACRQLAEWLSAGHSELYMSVNLSPSQFKQPDLVERVGGILSSLGLEGRHLKLELTEGVIMERPQEAARIMADLKDVGVRLSIDDFGTGYSSLSYLMQFPIDTVKIDRSFIEDLFGSQNNREIVRAIVSLARSTRMETLAEGVETIDQLSFVLDEGIETIQGFYFSRPIDAENFAKLLESGGRFDSNQLQ